MFIENLTEEQKSSLQQGYSHGKSTLFRRKCHCILQSNAGKTTKELASFFQVNIRSVLKWFKLWQTEGIEGLKLKPGRGRKPKLQIDNPDQVKFIKTLIKNECQNLNQVRGQVADKLGIEMSKRTLKRFLKNLNTNGNVSESV